MEPSLAANYFKKLDEGRVIDRMRKMQAELQSTRLTSRPQIQADYKGHKVRAVRNAIYFRPQHESFHDFQLKVLLWTLGEKWFDEEVKKPIDERHIILRWRQERNEQLERHRDPAAAPDAPIAAPYTGNIRALQVLADDIYQLEHALRTPKKVIDRLRDQRQFQGARNEILVASLFARCGFNIEFIDDSSKKNPEFFATKGSERIAVEAKSRHRPGILHERGDPRDAEAAPSKIRELYQEAVQQNPGSMPFLVFIDVNLPLTPNIAPMDKPWVKECMDAFQARRDEGHPSDRDSGLVLTNFGWHYFRDVGSRPGEHVMTMPENADHPISTDTWSLLGRALSEYGIIIDEEEHRKKVKARYPEFQ